MPKAPRDKQTRQKRSKDTTSISPSQTSTDYEERQRATNQFMASTLRGLTQDAKLGNTEAVKLLLDLSRNAFRALNAAPVDALKNLAPTETVWPVMWLTDSPAWIASVKEFFHQIGFGTKAVSPIARQLKKPSHTKDVSMALVRVIGAELAILNGTKLLNKVRRLQGKLSNEQRIDLEVAASKVEQLREDGTEYLGDLTSLLRLPGPIKRSAITPLHKAWTSLDPLSKNTFPQWFSAMMGLLEAVTDGQYQHERFGLRDSGRSKNMRTGASVSGEDELAYRNGIKENLWKASQRLLLDEGQRLKRGQRKDAR